jgi:DNA invertase Pin-like site-specific DNA recombinase
MERPTLKQLLRDVEDGKVNTIVVYKVDRRTRSLADFAKIVEALDASGVSFVSVTQQFNTTTSMGGLTLNVLLSFAQFEKGGMRREDSRQDCSFQAQRHVDGRSGTARIRRQGTKTDREPGTRKARRSSLSSLP